MAASPATHRLRLIQRPDTPIVRSIEILEAVYSRHHRQLLELLDGLDSELADADPSTAAAAHEQIAFMRVGMRCLADAVGELQAVAADTASEPLHNPHPANGTNPA